MRAFVAARQLPFTLVLQAYRQEGSRLLLRASPVTGAYSRTLPAAWRMSLAAIESESKAALELLRISAFLAPDSIPTELLSDNGQLGPLLTPPLQAMQDSPLVLHDLLEPLIRYSLIRMQPEAQAYSLHRLMQEVVRDSMSDLQRQEYAERTVRVVAGAHRGVLTHDCARNVRLLSHQQACAEHIARYGLHIPEAVSLLNQASFYLLQHGRYAEAQALQEQAVVTAQAAMGPQHPATIDSHLLLAVLYQAQAHFAEAESAYLRAREALEGGPSPPPELLFRLLRELGGLYLGLGRYSEAETALLQARALTEGTFHPLPEEAILLFGYLAETYLDQQRYVEAEALLQEALGKVRQHMDPSDNIVATLYGRLAALCRATDRAADAERFYRQTIALHERALGRSHPQLAMVLYELGTLYREQHRMEEAEALYREAVEVLEGTIGPAHPNFVRVLSAYACLLENTDRQEEAQAIQARWK
jgi:tetratricopeptide (TPR) repeat protein